MKWPMSDEEIKTMFREAKNKSEQVKILADMNLVNKHQMYNKLKELGCDISSVKAPRAKGGGRPKADPIDEIRAMVLYNEGLDDLAISESLGCSVSKVSAWRRMMKLPMQTKAVDVQEVVEEKPVEAIPLETPRQNPAYLTAGALLKILQRVCDGYAEDEVIIMASGINVRDVIVSVTYNSAGGVNGVQLDLMTE